MTQPGFFVEPGQEAKVCLLQKAIYGLKQSSRDWNKKVNEVLREISYKRSKIEPCLFWKKFQDNSIVIIVLYVDDFYVFHNNSNKKHELFLKLQKNFKIKDLGEATQSLGMKITRDRENNTLHLDQRDYVLSLLNKFGMSEAKGVNTPMDAKVTIGRGSGEHVNVTYQNAIGSLMYLSLCTRPDIAHVTNVLSQYNSEHTTEHWNHVKRALRYLKSTSHYRLSFQKDNNLNLTGFVDASWGSDLDDRRSYTGFVFKLANGPISWESRKQKSVALSPAEAEYMAASEATKDAIYSNRLLSGILRIRANPVKLFCDNQSAIKMANNPVFHNRTKHIDIRYHSIRDAVDEEKVQLFYIPTENMTADVLTKGLSRVKHLRCVKGLGICDKISS